MFLPAVSLLAAADFDVRKLEEVWQKNLEELKSNCGSIDAKPGCSKKVNV